MAVASIVVDFAANVAQISTDIQKIQRRFDTFGKNVSRTMTAVAGAITAGFAVLGTGAVIGKIAQTAQEMDTLAKSADRLSVSVSSLQKFSIAAGMAGSSAQTLEKFIQKMNEQIQRGAGGSKETEKNINALGLSLSELSKLNTEQRLLAVADAVKKIEDPARRTTLLTIAFGEESSKLSNFLSQGAEGIKAASDELEKMGLTLTRVDFAQVEIANDQMTKLQTVIGQVAQKFTAALAPAFSAATEAIIENSFEFAAFTNTVARGAESMVSQIGRLSEPIRTIVGLTSLTGKSIDFMLTSVTAAIALVINTLSIPIDAIIAGLKTMVNTAIDAVNSVVSLAMSIPLVGDKFAGIADSIESMRFENVAGNFEKAIDGSLAMIDAAFDSTSESFGELSKEFDDLVKKINSPVEKPGFIVSFERNLSKFKAKAQEVAKVAETAATGAPAQTANVGETSAVKSAKTTADAIKKTYELTAQDIQKSFASSFASAAKSGESFSKSIKSSLANLFIDKASNLIGAALFGGSGGGSGLLGGLFGGFFADGGRPPMGKASIVGERGPELFVPDKPGTIIPNGAAMAGGGGITIVQNMNFAEGVNAAARQELYNAMPEIKRQAVLAVREENARKGKR